MGYNGDEGGSQGNYFCFFVASLVCSIPGSNLNHFHAVQAMKIENMVRIKEEFDYKSLCRKLDRELNKLIAENERQGSLILEQEQGFQTKLEEAWNCASEAEKKLANALEVYTFYFVLLPRSTDCSSNTEILLELHLQTMAAEMAKLEREHSEALQSLECERTERQRIETELKKNIHNIQHQKEVCSAYV